MSFLPVGKLPQELLARLLEQYLSQDPRLIIGGGIGQDAAVIDMGDRYLVAKTDPITFATAEIGWYAVNVNANDVACTGARPGWFLATLLLPAQKTTPDLVESIFAQINRACRQLDIRFIGGHTEITYSLDRPLVIGQMLGEVAPERLVNIKQVQPGDEIILTKGIAVEATAIIAQEKEAELAGRFDQTTVEEFKNFLYEPGISVVKDAQVAVASGGVRAMHDPTEGGVATGLHELAYAGQVGLKIFEAQLPLLPATVELCQQFDLDPLGIIASGALLIATEPNAGAQIVQALAEAGIEASRIGRAQPQDQGVVLVDENGEVRPLPTFDRDEITRLFE